MYIYYRRPVGAPRALGGGAGAGAIAWCSPHPLLSPPPAPRAPPSQVIFDLLHATAYQDCGLGRTILGPDENIKSISRRDLQNYISTHYTGPRIVVAGAGAVDHAALVKLAEGTFGGLPSAPKDGSAVPDERAVFTGSALHQRDDDIPLAHVAIAFETGGWTNPHSFPLMIMQVGVGEGGPVNCAIVSTHRGTPHPHPVCLPIAPASIPPPPCRDSLMLMCVLPPSPPTQTILGNWDRTMGAGPNMASPLCRKVGEGQLAHSLSTFNTTYKDTGLFGVYTVAEPTKVWELYSNGESAQSPGARWGY